MRLRLLKASRRRARGQALVLAALSFLVLALMVTLSFNLSYALREKVSLQQHSDSLAYSMAVMEARAFNYYAVSNRAIAASYVAMNTMHAYQAAASVTGQMMRASRTNYYIIAAMEFAQCGCWTCIKHCIHGIKALRIASKYSKAGKKYDNKAKGLESGFNRTMKGLDRMVDIIHASQKRVHLNTAQALRNGQSHGLSALTDYNAPGASALPTGVGASNVNGFNCAVDGMPCMGGVRNSKRQALARVMTEVSNASRPDWPANRDLIANLPSHLHPSFLNELRRIPGSGLNYPLPLHKGTSKAAQTSGGMHGPGQVGGNEGLVITADEEGAMFNQWKHGIAPYMPYKSRVWSDRNGGGHNPSRAHSGQHRFEGVNTKGLLTCLLSGNCFMKFRADDNARREFGQPSVYSYVTRSLRAGDPRKAPWELNSSATLDFDNNASQARVTLAASQGAALSKALVYYHRFGDNGWREAPNMFNPYWRAKLHPFTTTEAATVLTLARDRDAAELAATSPGLSL